MKSPTLTIDLEGLTQNAKQVFEWYRSRGLNLVAVSKAVLGNPTIVKQWLSVGIDSIADSRIENIQTMRNAGVDAKFILTRTLLSQVETVVDCVDVCHSSDLNVLEAMGHASRLRGKKQDVILVVETGDLRDGILPSDFLSFYDKAREIEGINLIGVATNMGCVSGDSPTDAQLKTLCDLVLKVEQQFGQRLKTVSGGSSSAHDWIMSKEDCGRVNEVRIGELILLGQEPLSQRSVDGLNGDCFRLHAEVLEVDCKSEDDLLDLKYRESRSTRRAIIALGHQDVNVDALKPLGPFEIIGHSSDHLVLDATQKPLTVGDRVTFGLNYSALVSAMTCPFVHKELFIESTPLESAIAISSDAS